MPKVQIKDISYNLDKMNFYEKMDFHIGYRVHAHLYFLSRRIPTVLINEDGRGTGMVKTLKMPVLNIDDKNLFDKIKDTLRKYNSDDYGDFIEVKTVFDQKFKVMKSFLENLSTKY